MLRRSLVSFLFTSLWATLPLCSADREPYLRDGDYNEGKLGRYVTQKYKTSDLEPPIWNWMQPGDFSKCDDGSYIFLSPRGFAPDATFYIFDHEGSLVWGPDHHYGEVYNFQVQQYKGERVLIFWAGDDSIGGHGEGKYYMLDQHYQEHKVISAGEGIRADLHAFSLTPDGHAIYTGYEVVAHDLTELGRPADSYIWESLFQELDVETGEVMFEWRASEHFPFLDAYVNPNKATRNDPWDFFHINMVEKDAEGNYLVSTRYGRCVLYISGKTKEILWRLGGKSNSFKDLSDGDATTFLGQHDAHWYDGHNYITMFDNRGDWFHHIEDESKGKMIKIDLTDMTAELVSAYVHPNHILSTSQGSVQVLPNTNVLVGYGFNGAFTEYTFEGEALCSAYFEPSHKFGSGDVQSYRDLKSNWTGVPLTTPAIAYEDGMLYTSWLGSTKTRSWLLQDSDVADGLFQNVQTISKKGFETEYKLASGEPMRQYVRAIAVDEGGTQLSISPPVDLVDSSKIWGSKAPTKPRPVVEEPPHEEEHMDEHEHEHEDEHEHAHEEEHSSMREDLEDVQILLVLGVLAVISAVLIAFMAFGCRNAAFRRIRSEKEVFPGDGIFRRIWNGALSILPGRRKPWSQESRTGLLGRHTGDAIGDADGDYRFDER